MFVLVVDTSLMNVSISAVVNDLDTTVSGVQSAIALEALVSAAFILIGSKVGDLIGRKRAYMLGLLGYAVGALAMALAQNLTAVIVFWAYRRARCIAAAASDAVTHPRQLRGSCAEAGLRPGRGGGGHRRGGWSAARRLHHHLPIVAGRVRARGRRDHRRAVRHRPGPRRGVHRDRGHRRRRCAPLGPRHGRHRARHPGVAGGSRGGRHAARHRRRSRMAALAGGWCGASAPGRPR